MLMFGKQVTSSFLPNIKRSSFPIFIFSLFLTLFLAACGGGNGERHAASLSGDNQADFGNMPPDAAAKSIRWKVTTLFSNHPMHIAYGINDYGDIVGTYLSNYSEIRHFFISGSGEYHEFEDLVFEVSGVGTTDGAHMNNAGTIAGFAHYWDNRGAFLYREGLMTRIPEATSYSDHATPVASGINDNGVVVGRSLIATSGSECRNLRYSCGIGFAYSDSRKIEIAPLPGGTYSSAKAINDRAQIAGTSYTQSLASAFIHEGGVSKALGALPGFASTLSIDINSLGHIVGDAFNGQHEGVERPFLYKDGALQPIPIPAESGRSKAINDQGQVIGALNYGISTGEHRPSAFFYSGGETIDLAYLPEALSAGWKITHAMDINNRGQILVNAIRLDSDQNSPAQGILLFTPE